MNHVVRVRVRLLVAVIATLCSTGSLSAQDAGNQTSAEPKRSSDHVTVRSNSRTEQEIHLTPQSVSVKTDEDIQRAPANQIGEMFSHDPAVLESLLGGLFHIAMADDVMHPNELEFLNNISQSFGFNPHDFERICASHMGDQEANPNAFNPVVPGDGFPLSKIFHPTKGPMVTQTLRGLRMLPGQTVVLLVQVQAGQMAAAASPIRAWPQATLYCRM